MGANESTMHAQHLLSEVVSHLPTSGHAFVRASPHHRQSHQDLRQFVRSFLETEIFPHAHKWEEHGEIPNEVYRKFAQKGLIMPSLPRKHRGANSLPVHIPDEEWDLFHSCIIEEELARSPAIGPMWGLVSGNNLACPLILHYGNERQHDQYLPVVHRGEMRLCLAVSEHHTNGDISDIETTAETVKSDLFTLIVNGSKQQVATALWADHVVTLVRTLKHQQYVLSLLVIPFRTPSGDTTPGIKIEKAKVKGLHATGCADISFKNVRVSKANILGEEGKALEMLVGTYGMERLALIASGLVMAGTCLKEALDFARQRKSHGKALIENQNIQSRFARLTQAVETNHALYERIVWEVEKVATNHDNKELSGKDYVAAFSQPWVAARVALIKEQTGKTLEHALQEAPRILRRAGLKRKGVEKLFGLIERDMHAWVLGSEDILDEAGVHVQKQVKAKL